MAVTLDLEAKIPNVMADAGQINQALLNLCVNARDAMADCDWEGGARIISTLRGWVRETVVSDYGTLQPAQPCCQDVVVFQAIEPITIRTTSACCDWSESKKPIISFHSR